MRRLDDPFYPAAEIRAEGMLPVSDRHSIHWFAQGNPDGIPTIQAHGGPGGRANPSTALSDSERQHIVQFDQRGCGESTPTGELEENSLQATIADMERLREYLGIERWLVTGTSWGSTVALAYAETHPERCIGVKVAGVWLLRAEDVHWWYYGVRTVFPDMWDQYASRIPTEERHDLRGAYYRRIMDPDPAISEPAAYAQLLYEEAFEHLESALVKPTRERGIAYSRIFAHYAINDFFLRENQLIEDAQRIAHLPISLMTGRYDMCTTPNGAYDLAKALPRARLSIVNAAGHYPTEQNMGRAMALETCAFLDLLTQERHV